MVQTRERGERVVSRSVTMYPGDWEMLDDYAWRERLSTSEILRRLIRQHLAVEAPAGDEIKEALSAN